jgi:mycothiol synthase
MKYKMLSFTEFGYAGAMNTIPEIDIRMRRPTLTELSTVPALPNGYELHWFRSQHESLAAALTKAFDEPWDAARVRKDLTETPDVHAVYIVTYQGEVVSTASSQLREEHTTISGYVHWVGTVPEHRGKGLAYVLVARVLQDFVERGYTGAYLKTQPFRHAAIKTYLKLGFTPDYDVDGQDQQGIWSEIFQTMFKKG